MGPIVASDFGAPELEKEPSIVAMTDIDTNHYTETLPSARTIPKLSRSFYFRVRRLLKELRSQEAKDRSKGRDFDKALALARDIANIRIKKIASLGASSDQTTEQASNLTAEERALYDRIKQMIDEWKRDILGIEAAE